MSAPTPYHQRLGRTRCTGSTASFGNLMSSVMLVLLSFGLLQPPAGLAVDRAPRTRSGSVRASQGCGSQRSDRGHCSNGSPDFYFDPVRPADIADVAPNDLPHGSATKAAMLAPARSIAPTDARVGSIVTSHAVAATTPRYRPVGGRAPPRAL